VEQLTVVPSSGGCFRGGGGLHFVVVFGFMGCSRGCVGDGCGGRFGS